MSTPFVMWGATGQARVLYELLSPEHHLVALFDNDPAASSPFRDVPIYHGKRGFERWLKDARSGAIAFAVAIGGARGTDRLELQRYLERHGLTALTAVHRSAYVATGARLGKGCQILARSCIGVDARLGESCIVNTGAVVDHECDLGEGTHVGPGATLAGCVVVEPYAFIGAGAVVLPHLRIGRGAVVGAGAVVVEDVTAGAVVAGNPARALKSARLKKRAATKAYKRGAKKAGPRR